MLSEVTHLSILPHTCTIMATGIVCRRYEEGPDGEPVTGREYLPVNPMEEAPTTFYDGLVDR